MVLNYKLIFDNHEIKVLHDKNLMLRYLKQAYEDSRKNPIIEPRNYSAANAPLE